MQFLADNRYVYLNLVYQLEISITISLKNYSYQ